MAPSAVTRLENEPMTKMMFRNDHLSNFAAYYFYVNLCCSEEMMICQMFVYFGEFHIVKFCGFDLFLKIPV